MSQRLFGFYNASTGAWLNNDFQAPHYYDVDEYIAANYKNVESFTLQHGTPEDWKKKEASPIEIESALDIPIATLRRDAARSWNTQLNIFIMKFVDMGSQLSLLKKAVKILRKEVKGEKTQKDIENELSIYTLDAWIDTVLLYYYQQKSVILTAETPEIIKAILSETNLDDKFGESGSIQAYPGKTLEGLFLK
jgi:hypothetical protein